MKTKEWVCTDPDTFQYGRRMKLGVYEFKEFDRLTFMSKFQELKEMPHEEAKKIIEADFNCQDFWVNGTVDISGATRKQKEFYIEGYYDSLGALELICAGKMSQVNWIVAECYFEQFLSGLY